MSRSRRTYTRAFKLEAVRQWQTSGKSAAEIERELGIGAGNLSRWKTRLQADGESAFPGHGRLKPRQDRIRNLLREKTIVLQEMPSSGKAITFVTRRRRSGSSLLTTTGMSSRCTPCASCWRCRRVATTPGGAGGGSDLEGAWVRGWP